MIVTAERAIIANNDKRDNDTTDEHFKEHNKIAWLEGGGL